MKNTFKDEKNYLYELFSKKLNDTKIKNLFSDVNSTENINGGLLVCALLGAIENKQEQYIPRIFEFIDNKNIKFSDGESQIIFNCASMHGSKELLNFINDELAIVDKTFNKDGYVRIDSKGKIERIGDLPSLSDPMESKKLEYFYNPLLFSLINFNEEALELLLDNSRTINHSIIEASFIESCVENNDNAIFYLIDHEKTKDIVRNSKIINLFLNEKTELLELKRKTLVSLEVVKLKDELPQNNVSKSRLKI